MRENPGPQRLTGICPAEVDRRDGSRFWLVHGPTFVFGARCHSLDVARALVLDKLGYGPDRIELADHLSARPATRDEVNAVALVTRRRPLAVTKGRGRFLAHLLAALYKHDIRATGVLREGGVVSEGEL